MRVRSPRGTRPDGSGVSVNLLFLRYSSSGISTLHNCQPSAFPHNLFRSLVVAQSQEPRMSQFSVHGPLGEANLGNESRFHPMHAASRQRIVGKGWVRYLQLRKLFAQVLQQVIIEPRSDLACVNERSSEVEAQHQCTEAATAHNRNRGAATQRC